MPKSTIQFEQLIPIIDVSTAARRREVWEVVLPAVTRVRAQFCELRDLGVV